MFAEGLDLKAELFKQLSELLQQPQLFRRDAFGNRHKELLRGDFPRLRFQTVKVYPLVGGVLVDQDDAVLHLDNDIGFQCLTHDLSYQHLEQSFRPASPAPPFFLPAFRRISSAVLPLSPSPRL